jgi:hypothetical protein
MALSAHDAAMSGGPPRFHIGIHLVTDAAKGGSLREFEKNRKENEKGDNTKKEKDSYCFFVRLN